MKKITSLKSKLYLDLRRTNLIFYAKIVVQIGFGPFPHHKLIIKLELVWSFAVMMENSLPVFLKKPKCPFEAELAEALSAREAISLAKVFILDADSFSVIKLICSFEDTLSDSHLLVILLVIFLFIPVKYCVNCEYLLIFGLWT